MLRWGRGEGSVPKGRSAVLGASAAAYVSYTGAGSVTPPEASLATGGPHTRGAAFTPGVPPSHTRWVPTSVNMTRLALPGGPGTQDHMYSKRSPRLVYALNDDDPGALSPSRTPPRPPAPRPARPRPLHAHRAPLSTTLRPYASPVAVCAVLRQAKLMNRQGGLR